MQRESHAECLRIHPPREMGSGPALSLENQTCLREVSPEPFNCLFCWVGFSESVHLRDTGDRSWKHSSINCSYTNLHLKICFWGNPSGDNRILSPTSWTHYVTVTRRITNYNSWTYRKGLYMLSMCFPCLEHPGCFCQANSHSSSKTQLKTQFHHLLEASSQHVFTSIPNMCSFRSLCFPLAHILLYQTVIIYLLAWARLRLS